MTGRTSLHPGSDDGGGFGRRRQTAEMDLDITPMIDVTFLLLIFFMVASTMQATIEDNIPPAKHGVGIETGRSTIISIRLADAEDSSPVIVLGEGRGPQAGLEDVADYVREGVDNKRSRIVIKADRDVPHGFVQSVARAANTVDGIQFFIAVRDKQSN
jgi:biopolymer transport protein ExbD